MKKFITAFSIFVACAANAATLDITGLNQQDGTGANKPVVITGVADGEVLFTTGTAGSINSRKIITTDINDSTAIGRSLLTAADQSAVQAIVGAVSPTVPSQRVAYGNTDNTITSEAGFTYDPTLNRLASVSSSFGDVIIGNTISLTKSGASTLIINDTGTSEALTLELGLTLANTVLVGTSTGINKVDFGTSGINVVVPADPYDSSWDGNFSAASKEDIYNQIEAMILSGGSALTNQYIGYGSATNTLTGEAAFSYNATTNTVTAGNVSADTFTAGTSVTSDTIFLKDVEGSGAQEIEFYAGADVTAPRRFGFITPDADAEVTFLSSLTVAGINVPNSWTDGIKQTFNPNATTAGINVGSLAGDPSAPANGDVWYDSTANELTARINGANVPLGAGGGGTLTATYVGYGDGSNALTGENVFNYNATTNTLTVPNVDTSSGTATVGPLKTSDGKHLLNDLSIYVSVASGGDTAYPLTGTSAALNTGAEDPVLVIDSPGTYLINVRMQVDYANATIVNETATLKLSRTNNTPGDISNATTTIDLPASSTLTHTYGYVTLPPVIYTTLNSDDSLTIFGAISGVPSNGNINISEASIVAVRIR